MNSSTKVALAITRSSPIRSSYMCLQCRHRALTTSASARIQSTTPSSATFTERLRRRILGPQNPLGKQNPYGDDSVFYPTKNKKQGAKLEDDVPEEKLDVSKDDDILHHDYVPATTWDGLKHIGGRKNPREDAWDQENQFSGFMSAIKLESSEKIKQAILLAVIEVYEPDTQQNTTEALDAPDETVLSDLSKAQINFSAQEHQPHTLRPRRTSAVAIPLEDEEAAQPDNVLGNELEQSNDIMQFEELDTTLDEEKWLNVTFTDPEKKFAVFKRVMQLTGIRIPDPAISNIHTSLDLFNHHLEKPKPKKLAETLMAVNNSLALPNVQIMDRRYTPIDKEKEVGRWKVIESELKKRGLPVTRNS